MDEREAQLAAARAALRERRWPQARERFRAARARGELDATDLAALADACWWLGLVEESVAAGEAAYPALLATGQTRRAAMAAIGVAVNHLLRDGEGPGAGWLGRAAAALAGDPECAEAGQLRYLTEVEAGLGGPDLDAVLVAARDVAALGRRLGDPNLVAQGLVGEGRVLVKQGRAAAGLALLDAAMVGVADGVVPETTGNVYCHVIAACHELGDVRRAAQWTAELERWLARLPAAVVFTGICRVHRSQLLQLTGEWDRAEQVAAQVCAELDGIFCAAAAEGHYQVGEMHRLRGRPDAADAAFTRAHRLGRDPQPGLALLRLAQGRPDTAAASIRAALIAQAGDRLARARLCAAQAEIALAAGDVPAARKAAAELADTAAAYAGPGLTGWAAHTAGAVLLADGDPAEALPVLRDACGRWLELGARYDAARTRLLLADAYARLADPDAACRELDAAEEEFAALGAPADLAAVAARRPRPAAPAGLTARELEVLACLAAGRTNREIAAALVISEKTVARHLSNIFPKLGVGTRTAAAAHAHRLGLVPHGWNDPSPVRRGAPSGR